MALIKCPECGQMISEYAEKCVSCGCPIDVIKSLLSKKLEKEASNAANEDGPSSRVPFMQKISNSESDFIERFKEFFNSNYKEYFKMRNYDHYFAIRSKSLNKNIFLFAKKNREFIFKYKETNDKYLDYVIKEPNDYYFQKVIDITKDTIAKHNNAFNRKEEPQEVANDEKAETANSKQSKSSDRDSFYESLDNGRRSFAISVENYFDNRYKERISISNNSLFLFFKNPADNKNVFWFKKSSGTLEFCCRLKDSESITKLGIQVYKNELFKIISEKATSALTSYGIYPIDYVIPEETVLVKQNGGEGPIQQSPFLNSLTPKQKSFLLSYLAKVNKKHGNMFIFSSNQKSFSLMVNNAQEYRCVFAKIGDKLLFFYKANINEEIKDIEVDNFDDEMMSALIQKTNYVVATYNAKPFQKGNKSTIGIEKEEPLVKKTMIEPRLFEMIRQEMLGNKYEAMPSKRALCKSLKKYLLDVFNHNIKTNKFYDVVFASTVATFYGQHLAWNKNEGIRSAKIVYGYFKAQTVISKILDYEAIFKKESQIVTDYMALLSYLYKEIDAEKDIDYQHAPGLSADFSLVPEQVLIEILNNFKAYEND